jgi:hypothetical protein
MEVFQQFQDRYLKIHVPDGSVTLEQPLQLIGKKDVGYTSRHFRGWFWKSEILLMLVNFPKRNLPEVPSSSSDI